MGHSTLYLIIVVLGFFAVILGVFAVFYYQQPIISASGEAFLCKNILINGDAENKIDVVLFFDGVDEKEAGDYINYLLDVSPFSENKEKFNFYSVNMAPSCEITNGILICYSREIIRASSLCPNEYVIVLSKQSSGTRSSAYMNLISVNIANKKTVVAHEFGHIFANLADEYVPSSIPRGSDNCVSSCDKFSGETDGCYGGCSKNDMFRSIEAGLMRTLGTNNYGKFDKAIVEGALNKYE